MTNPIMTNPMHRFWLALLIMAVSAALSATAAPPKAGLRAVSQAGSVRLVIGSLADVAATHEQSQAMTIIHILDFRIDAFPGEPDLLQIRLCGDWSNALAALVHTNIAFVYNQASPSKSTDCLPFISLEPWQDDTLWQTITPGFKRVERSMKHANPTFGSSGSSPDN